MDEADADRALRAKARSDLEAYIFSARDYMYSNEESIEGVTTSEQREGIMETLMELEDWLYEEEAERAAATVLDGKRDSIKARVEAIAERAAEVEARPAAVAHARERIANMTRAVEQWNNETKPQLSSVEVELMKSTIADVSSWIDEQEEAQAGKEAHEELAFTSKDVAAKVKTAWSMYRRYAKRPKPTPTPTPTPTPDPEADASQEAGTEGTEAGEAEGEGEASPGTADTEVEAGAGTETEAEAEAGAEVEAETETEAEAETEADTEVEAEAGAGAEAEAEAEAETETDADAGAGAGAGAEAEAEAEAEGSEL
jgi:hypothetical protein